jgi:hypothetical protein
MVMKDCAFNSECASPFCEEMYQVLNAKEMRGATAAIVFGIAQLAVAGASPAQTGATLPPYRAPVIALAQPPNGGSVPQDKPVAVFRFTAGESTDPIDIGTFAVSVDGEEHTSLFQKTATEAWGPISDGAKQIELGNHQIVARICSSRGACSTTTAMITVGAAGPASSAHEAKGAKTKAKILDAVFSALRTLLRS